jgi:predicted  nucleic acid-binding Zn-ribbon protein
MSVMPKVVNNQLSLIETIDKISFVMTNTDGFADKARNVQQELEATDSVDKTSKNANNTYEEMENDMVTLSTDLKEFYDQIFDDNKKLVEKPFKPDYSFSIEYQDEGQYYSRFMNAMYQKILNDKDTVILKLLNDRLGNINKWDRYVNNLVDDLQRNYEKVQRKTERELDRFSKRSSVRKFNDYSPFTKEKERIFYYINVPKENINSVRDGYFNELYSGLNKGTAESYNGKVTFN